MNKTNAELDAEIAQLDAEAEADAEAERRAQPPHLPPPTEPLQVVREFVENRCRHGDYRIFRYWRGGWWLWQTSHWIEVDEGTLRSELYHFTEKAHYINKPWQADAVGTDHR